MLEWHGNIAIGRDKNHKITFYEIQANGDLWLSGDNWSNKSKTKTVKYPDRICRVKSIEKAKLVAENLNKLENI